MIRPLSNDDLPVVSEMVKDSFSSSLWPYMTYTQHGLARYLQVALDFPRSVNARHLVVACDDHSGDPIGFADFAVGHDHIGFLSYICVDPSARGRGLATAMFQNFLETNPGLKAVKLDTFRENSTARALYGRWGFTVEGTTAWVTRDLPPAADPAKIDALAVSLAAHELYGFCELAVVSDERRRVGMIGESVLRCFARETFEDDAVLGAVRGTFEHLTTAFAVLPEAAERELAVAHDVLLLSDRMSLSLDGNGTT